MKQMLFMMMVMGVIKIEAMDGRDPELGMRHDITTAPVSLNTAYYPQLTNDHTMYQPPQPEQLAQIAIAAAQPIVVYVPANEWRKSICQAGIVLFVMGTIFGMKLSMHYCHS